MHNRTSADALRVHGHDVFAAGSVETCPQRRAEPVRFDSTIRTRELTAAAVSGRTIQPDTMISLVDAESIQLPKEFARNTLPIGARAGY